MDKLFLIFIACSFIFTSKSFTQSDTLWVEYESQTGLTTNYLFKKGQTIFGLSHAFGGEVSSTIEINDDMDLSTITINKSVKFIVNPDIIVTEETESNICPVFYKVKPQETLYTISRIYARKDVTQIMQLNGKKSYNLSVDEPILLGYIAAPYYNKTELTPEPITPNISLPIIETDKEPIIISIVDSVDSVNTEVTEIEEIPLSLKKEKGLALWESTTNSNDELMVMHSSAKVNSKMELYNPMMKKSVNATVVGQLPKNSYPENISIVISPAVASALGALDKRFLVEITYVE